MDSLPLIIRLILFLLPLSIVFSIVLWHPFIVLVNMILSTLNFLFKCIYVILDFPISLLTNSFGGVFYKFDNALSQVFYNIDSWIQKCILFLKKPENTKKRFMPIYLTVVIIIYISSFFNNSNSLVNAPYKLYMNLDSFIVSKVADMSKSPNSKTSIESNEINNRFSFELLVQGTTSSLIVRDSPRTKNCEVVDYVKNGDTVSWNGVLTFGENDNKRQEAWVEVVTANGITGWARLSYLVPLDNVEGMTWQLQKELD